MTNPVNKLLAALGENTALSPDKWSLEHLCQADNKKWISNIVPLELLTRSVKQAVETLVTINEANEFYKEFPNEIQTPNYGHKWGRIANYIEINNRAIAEMYQDRTKNGILSSIKLLPAIPPSAKSWANCVILSQIFPNIYGDGYNKGVGEENSIYGIRLNAGYSQIKVATPYKDDITLDWKNPEHQELFINEHVKLIKLGFEAVFIDSAKHIGGYDMSNYAGVGALPEYNQMQYILHEIRKRSGSETLSFVGEKSTGDFARYQNLGLTAGTAFVSPDNYDKVKCWSTKFKYSKDYAPGVEVSNDNDMGGRSYEERLQRINSILFAYEYPSDKLPSFMQMEDLFPLRYDTSTHNLMMTNPSFSEDGTPESHWENLFTKDDGRVYNSKAASLFRYALNL